MLRACYVLLKPGGRIAFTNIYIAPGVSERDYRRASRSRGPGAAERRAMTEMLDTAGFTGITERDVTAAFRRTTRAFLETSALHEEDLRRAWGDASFEERQRDRAATLALIDEGVVRRSIFVAVKPANI